MNQNRREADRVTDTITIKDLEAYRGMAAELESLEAMRMWTYFPVSSPNGHENIGQRGNSVSNPTEQAVLRLEEIDERISQKREELSVQLERILNWVDSIEDPTIRAMIQWHYLHGLDWGKTCRKVYGYHNYHTCRSAVLRFMGVKK